MATMTQHSMDDHVTQLQLKLLQQRLDNEKEKVDSDLNRQGEELLTHAQKLQQAVQRRQELLDKIQEEQKRREELRRPRSHDRRRKYRAPSPDRPTSLPNLQGATPRTVVEHKFSAVPAAAGGGTQQLPQIIQVPPDPSNRNWKGDMMEMMMMQNAQMHQMMVQQMMLSSLGNQRQNSQLSIPVSPDMLNIKPGKSLGDREVHHHHYGQEPQQQQAPQPAPAQQFPVRDGYTQLPPIYTNPAYYDPYKTFRPYPWEVEPLRPPKRYESFLHKQYRKQRHESDDSDDDHD